MIHSPYFSLSSPNTEPYDNLNLCDEKEFNVSHYHKQTNCPKCIEKIVVSKVSDIKRYGYWVDYGLTPRGEEET